MSDYRVVIMAPMVVDIKNAIDPMHARLKAFEMVSDHYAASGTMRPTAYDIRILSVEDISK